MGAHDVQLLPGAMSTQVPVETGPVPFRCPRCCGGIRIREAVAQCTSCSAEYAIRDGIHDFRCGRHDYYFNPVPRRDMAALIDAAPDVSWDDTVRGFMGHISNVPGWTDNVEVNARYAWKLFLDLPPGARFLDLGCGLGNLTRNIAPHVGEVVALDLTWERLRFAQQRFAKFNARDRITVVAGGDGPHLPFPDAHFDCIALSGVLEWIADDSSLYAGRSRGSKIMAMAMSFFGERNPRAVQLRFMRELRRVLKPDGQLFVAIENRLSYEYFGERPDHHSRLWFGSLLPRFAANLYSIALRRRPYRTYTYSFGGLRRLFTAAGFPHHEGYGLTPGYSKLAEIVPTSTSHASWNVDRPSTLAERIKRNENLVPAFGMAARASPSQASPLVARLLDEISSRVPNLGSPALKRCSITRGERIIIRLETSQRELILRIPASADALAAEDRQVRVLTELAQRGVLDALVPRPIVHGVHQAIPYYLETSLPGEPMAAHPTPMARARAARLVGDLLDRMGARKVERSCGDPESGFHASELAAPLRLLADVGADSQVCDALRHRLMRTLAAQPWQATLRHGQMGPQNLLVASGSLSGVIGWEFAVAEGIPALDALHYVANSGINHEPGVDALAVFQRMARWEWSCEEEVALLREVYKKAGIDVAHHEDLCLLAAVHRVAQSSRTTARFDPKFVSRAIEGLVACLRG